MVVEVGGEGGVKVMSTVKVPPVLGWRATSPRAVENVDRSSWAYYCGEEGSEISWARS